MTRALAPRPPEATQDGEEITLIVPSTGELVPLTGPTDQLAQVVEDIREWEAVARFAKNVISQEIHRRMDERAEWTLRAGDYKVQGESPGRVEYDGDALYATLRSLVDDGHLQPDAADRALERVVTYKPRRAGINALLKLGGTVAAAVRSCERPKQGDRRIRVSRARA